MNPTVLLVLVGVVLVSGCVSGNPSEIARSHPVAMEFLAEHPNAVVTETFYTPDQVNGFLQSLRNDCNQFDLQPRILFNLNLFDQGESVIAWVDVEDGFVQCVIDNRLPPCAGVVCDPFCEGNVSFTNGTCSEGACVYEEQECQLGCAGEGVCNLPALPDVCGNGLCEEGEDFVNCSEDCEVVTPEVKLNTVVESFENPYRIAFYVLCTSPLNVTCLLDLDDGTSMDINASELTVFTREYNVSNETTFKPFLTGTDSLGQTSIVTSFFTIGG